MFFPPGHYVVDYLTVGSSSEVSVELIGSGKDCSILSGKNISGFVISKGTQRYDNIARIEGLNVSNSGGIGGIKVTGAAVGIIDCRAAGGIAIDSSLASGASIYDTEVVCSGNGVPNSPSPGNTPGTIGFCVGQGTIVDCRAQLCDIGYAMSGEGASCISCSSEVNNTGIRVGWSSAGETPAIGCSVQNFQTERCNTAMDLYNAQGCFIAGNILTGGAGTPGPTGGPITNMVWDSVGPQHLVTVTTTGPHYIPVGSHILQFDLNKPGFSAAWLPPAMAGIGYVTATVTSPNTFTYSGVVSNPGAFVAAEWNYPLQYTLRCRIVTETVIIANQLPMAASVASVDLDYGGAAQHRNNVFACAESNCGWLMPTNSANLAGWKFINCTATNNLAGFGTVPNAFGKMHFSDLPGQPGVYQDGPFEGQEFDILDGQRASDNRVAGFAEVVHGGGGGHYKVRYDGSKWTRIG